MAQREIIKLRSDAQFKAAVAAAARARNLTVSQFVRDQLAAAVQLRLASAAAARV